MSFPEKSCRLPAALATLAAVLTVACPATGGVVVICNRTTEKVDFSVVIPGKKISVHSLQPRDLLPVPTSTKIGVAFDSAAGPRRYLARENSIHCFLTKAGKRDLIRLDVPGSDAAGSASPAAAKNSAPPAASLHKIPVMLLVDDNEPAVKRLWEQRLRDRLAAASDIFEKHCRIRFEVAAMGRWNSDERIGDFQKSLREFELEVAPAPARLAIGFTSQYRIPKGRTHLGGTRGAFYTHILIREWSQHITKSERLEVLVHELGHYLGASHCPEYDSVMRPTLGDRRSHAKDFRVGFDPVNTLIMNVIGEEIRSRPLRSMRHLRTKTKIRLRGAYQSLQKLIPDDPSTKQYLEMLESPLYVRPEPKRRSDPLARAAKRVVAAIAAAAEENAAAKGEARLGGDRLAELYVRRAAAAADKLPDQQAAKAFLVGLGVALDHSNLLRNYPIVRDLSREIESSTDRYRRLARLGIPTMHGRRDLLQHFVISGTLTSLVGAEAAETVGVMKEISDARGRSGFSFADLSADIAGTTFATHVRESKIGLGSLADSFTVKDFFPPPDKLEEGISWDEFVKKYSSAQDERFKNELNAIRARIRALPRYRKKQ